MEYTEDELAKMGYKELGRLMGSGMYKGKDWTLLAKLHNLAKKRNQY